MTCLSRFSSSFLATCPRRPYATCLPSTGACPGVPSEPASDARRSCRAPLSGSCTLCPKPGSGKELGDLGLQGTAYNHVCGLNIDRQVCVKLKGESKQRG